jgi:hypothetical protein
LDGTVAEDDIADISDSLFSLGSNQIAGRLSDHLGRIFEVGQEGIDDIP